MNALKHHIIIIKSYFILKTYDVKVSSFDSIFNLGPIPEERYLGHWDALTNLLSYIVLLSTLLHLFGFDSEE